MARASRWLEVLSRMSSHEQQSSGAVARRGAEGARAAALRAAVAELRSELKS